MSKIISINKRYYPVEAFFNPIIIPIITTTVLVEGDVEDYAAYTGHGDPEWVAQFGDKLDFREARVHFPSIIKEHYRS